MSFMIVFQRAAESVGMLARFVDALRYFRALDSPSMILQRICTYYGPLKRMLQVIVGYSLV